MKTANLSLMLATIMVASVAMTGAAYATTPSSHGHEEVQHAQAQEKHEGYGVLKAVNMEGGRVRLAHEAITSLGWPAMTMWFALRVPFPPEIKVGDSVRFELQQQDKEWVVTGIERRK